MIEIITDEFQAVKNTIKNYLKKNEWFFEEHQVKLEVLNEEPEFYRALLKNKSSLAEILIEKPDYAPYRYVSFQKGFLDGDDMVFWYDKDGDSPHDVLEKISEEVKEMFDK